MDWPIFGAIGGVTVLAVAVTVGAAAIVRATPEPSTKKAIAMAPLVRFEPRPEVGILNGPKLANFSPAYYDTDSAPTRVRPPKGAPQAALAREPSEQHVRHVASPPEQSRPLDQIAAKPMLPSTRIAPSTLRPDQKEITRRLVRPVRSDGPPVLIVGLAW